MNKQEQNNLPQENYQCTREVCENEGWSISAITALSRDRIKIKNKKNTPQNLEKTNVFSITYNIADDNTPYHSWVGKSDLGKDIYLHVMIQRWTGIVKWV